MNRYNGRNTYIKQWIQKYTILQHINCPIAKHFTFNQTGERK
jgi:hypothetical protein